MKRWAGPAILVLITCLLILIWYPKSHRLLGEDTDTAILLSRIAEPHSPWKWFTGDWPLQNHFYRPITSLTFEVDSRFFGSGANTLFLTSALICSLCVLAVFWLAAEMGLRPYAAASAGVLFGFWQMPLDVEWDIIAIIAGILGGCLLLIGAARHASALGRYFPAALALGYFASELQGPFHREAPNGFYMAVEAWLPGRTASVVCLFAVAAMAAYLRYEKLRSPAPPDHPLSTDLPATRTSTQKSAAPGRAWPFALAAFGFEVLALGSYEQAVMLPIVLLVLATCVAVTGRKPDWRVHAGFWTLLVGYLILRGAVLPSAASSYQLRAFRVGPGVFISLAEYAFPTLADLPAWIGSMSLGTSLLLSPGFYAWPLTLAGNLVSYVEGFKKIRLAIVTWAMSLAAVLPMAFLKPFAHYHYWPAAIRSIFVVALFGAVTKLVVSAVSLPSLQAPGRPSPAPGSLPRQ